MPDHFFLRRARQAWSEDSSLRARVLNIGHLLTGNFFGSMLGMLAFVVTARALGPSDYGSLALTLSYVRAVQLLVAFQSWQPLIKYGAELQGAEKRDDYRCLMKFGLLVDVSAAALACTAAVTGALLFGPLLGIDARSLTNVLIYSMSLLFQITGTPTAVLRLAGRFRLAAYGPLVGTAVRLTLCIIGLVIGAGPLYFVVVWTVTQISGALAFLMLALIELRRQGVRNLLTAPLGGVTQRFRGLLSFTIGSNVELTLRSSTSEFDTLLVGALAGPTAAGLYHISKRLGRMVLQLGVQVQAVLYPDVARLWAQRQLREFGKTVLQTEVMLAAFGLLVVIVTALSIRPLLVRTAGVGFADAAPLAVVQMIAVAMTLSGSVVRSALLAMGRQPTVLRIVIGATLAFQATAFIAIPHFGAMGANIAQVVMATISICGLTFVYRRMLRKAEAAAVDP
jgi:O-antigen/teichoic acid export membrane protein